MTENGSISYMDLVGQNMPHILEEIFLHLDRQSIVICKNVCQRWEKILSSDNFKTSWNRLHPTKSWSPPIFCHGDHYFMDMLMWVWEKTEEWKPNKQIWDWGCMDLTWMDPKKYCESHLIQHPVVVLYRREPVVLSPVQGHGHVHLLQQPRQRLRLAVELWTIEID